MCTKCAPGVHQDRCAPSVHQVCTRCAPGVHQVFIIWVCTMCSLFTRCAPGVHQVCTGVCTGVCTRCAPGVQSHITKMPLISRNRYILSVDGSMPLVNISKRRNFFVLQNLNIDVGFGRNKTQDLKLCSNKLKCCVKILNLNYST